MRVHIQKLIDFNLGYLGTKNWMVVLTQRYGRLTIKDTTGEKFIYLKTIYVLRVG